MPFGIETYLTDKGQDQVVDAEISLKSRSKAREEHCMMNKERRCPGIVEVFPQHIPLIVSEVAT